MKLFLLVVFVKWFHLTVVTGEVTRSINPSDYCVNLPEGSPYVDMYEVTSINGVLKVILKFNSNIVDGQLNYCYIQHHKKQRTFVQSPTLRLFPGEKLIVKLVNQIPESYIPLGTIMNNAFCMNKTATTSSTNIHFHGLEVAPICQDDNVLMTVVNSFESYLYDVDIPFTQPPGLYWYHPHVHPLATEQVGGGASGAIVVEGIEQVQPLVAGMWEQIMVFRQSISGLLTLNYIIIDTEPVVMSIQPNQTEFWRIVNAGVELDLNLTLMYDGVPQNFTIISLDGVVVGTAYTADTLVTQTLVIATAARAEVIITAPAEGQSALLINTGQNTGPLIKLTASTTAPNPSNKLPDLLNVTFPTFVRISVNLLTMIPVKEHVLRFTQNTSDLHNLRWWVTADQASQQLFSMNAKPSIVSYQGTVEDWTIINDTPQSHNFHIHQMHFIPLARDGQPLPIKEQQYRDVIAVPGQTIDFTRGEIITHNVTIRMDFTREAVVGLFVYHCHILLHEDHGMMAIIQVKPQQALPTSQPSVEPTESTAPPTSDNTTSSSTYNSYSGGWATFYVVYIAMALVVILVMLLALLSVFYQRIVS